MTCPPATDRAVWPTFRYSCFRADHLRALLVSVAVATFSFNPAFGQAPQAEDATTTIRGIVINSVTHEPIARALVYSSDNRFAVLTNGSGEFEFALPQAKTEAPPGIGGGIYSSFTGRVRSLPFAGRLSLAARKPGFLDPPSGREEVTTPDGSEVTLSLVPEALIKGRITLSTGDAAMRVTVQLYSRQVMDGLPRWVPGMTTNTNSAGEVRFAELQAGTYKLVTHEFMDNDPVTQLPGVQLYGYPPVYYPAATDLASAATIELTAGQTLETNLALALQPYYPVKVPVANGPVDGAMNVSVKGQRGPGYSLGYNPGEGRIEGLLPSGNYIVEAATYGPNAAMGKVNLRVTGQPADGPGMTLVPDSSITFRVNAEFSQADGSFMLSPRLGQRIGPVQFLQPRLENVDDFEQPRGGAIRPATGPPYDSLVMDNVAPGRYWLRLDTGRGYVASATAGGADLLYQPIVIGSASNTTVEVTLRDDGAEVDGTVTTPGIQAAGKDGAWPAGWVYFIPLPNSSGHFEAVGVSGDGKFALANVPPGSYRVLAFANMQPNLPYRDPEGMKAYETKGQVIQLSAGQKTTIQAQIVRE